MEVISSKVNEITSGLYEEYDFHDRHSKLHTNTVHTKNRRTITGGPRDSQDPGHGTCILTKSSLINCQ